MSGTPDADRIYLMMSDDRTLINACSANRYFRDKVCNDEFYKQRLIQKHPSLLQYKPEEMSYKQFYLSNMYYISKLKERYSVDYGSGYILGYAIGDPKKIYNKLETKTKYALFEAIRENNLNIVEEIVEKGISASARDKALRIAMIYNRRDIVDYL